MFADLSDFEAALGRARITTLPESPTRLATFDLEGSDTEGSPTSLSEGRFDFPCTPVSENLSKQFLTMDPEEEDMMMKTAASEIAKSLGLPVRRSANLMQLCFCRVIVDEDAARVNFHT